MKNLLFETDKGSVIAEKVDQDNHLIYVIETNDGVIEEYAEKVIVTKTYEKPISEMVITEVRGL